MTKTPRALLIPFEVLEVKEQLDLIFAIFEFAQKKLPDEKMLPILLVPYGKEEE